ncbi:MAG: hypothetical protein JST00_29005 [Deltaproteobacteria bacterium]|nr:hypothetical protein [Deltaproteobacteria bacterium]
MRHLRVSLALALALALGSASGRAVADDDASEARAQYQQGTQAFQQKRYSEAALHFEAAAALRPNAVTLYTAGLAWDNAARPERAADAYARSLDIGGLDPKQAGLARDRVSQLEKTLGTLAVTAPEGWKVQLDTFTEVVAPARLHGAPGVHALSVRAPGRPIERRDVSLDAGKVTALDLKDEPKVTAKVDVEPPKPPPPVESPKPPPLRSSSYWIPRRLVGIGATGVGAAFLASGIVLGLNANDAGVAYDVKPTRESFDHASSLQTWTNVAFISSAIFVAGGLALVLWPDKDSEAEVRLGVGPTGATFAGSF